MSEGWICRDRKQFDNFCAHIVEHWDWSRPLKISWATASASRSLGQLALAHIWFRAIADHVNREQPGHDFDEGDMKTYLKRQFGIRIQKVNPITGKEETVLKSLGKYEKGEMYDFMCKVDAYAASIGCLLPCWGEYEQIKREAA